MIYGVIKAKVEVAALTQAVDQFSKKFKKASTGQLVEMHLAGDQLCFKTESGVNECVRVEYVLEACVNVDCSNIDTVLIERVDQIKKLSKHLKNWKSHGIQVIYLQIRNGAWDITID